MRLQKPQCECERNDAVNMEGMQRCPPVCPIFVLPIRSEPPARAGKLAYCTYDDFDDFQAAIVTEVQKKPFVSRYEPFQLAGGFFFVVKSVNVGAGERPGRPIGNGIVAGSVTLEEGDCVLLDISSCECRGGG